MSEFIPLFTELLEVRTITRHILEEARGAAIYVSPAKVDGLTATVPVLIRTRDGKEIPVEFRMVESGGGWLAYDLSIAGVSLISNYRAQFNQILSRDGATFDGLLKKIRERISRELERPTKAER
jgi:phospholipid transport system substrate-binding protein